MSYNTSIPYVEDSARRMNLCLPDVSSLLSNDRLRFDSMSKAGNEMAAK